MLHLTYGQTGTFYVTTEEKRINTSADSTNIRLLFKFTNDMNKSTVYAYGQSQTHKDALGIYQRHTKVTINHNTTENVYTGSVDFKPFGYWKYEIYEVSWVSDTILLGSGTAPINETQVLTVNDVMVKNTGDAITGNIDIQVAGSTDNCLTIVGGNSAAANAAVSIEGHLEATTKSFNIPHPLLEHKRLVYGSLEGPEHGMYARGSFDINDERRKVAIDLPMYWSKMVHPDYTVNLTTYGDYNVWIKERDENGFWVETNSEKEWSFDWNVIGGRKDAKLVVEPDA